MAKKNALENLSLSEVSDLFQQSLAIEFPKFNKALVRKYKQLKKLGVINLKWIKTYEAFKGTQLNFYCEKTSQHPFPIINIGMTHRTEHGLILITIDTTNGGFPASSFTRDSGWEHWVRIYTGDFCKRFAKRILRVKPASFAVGANEIMFKDRGGPVRVIDTIAEGIDEIEFQFKEGRAYGYRDSESKITYFRTVYSKEMLKGDRPDFRNEWEQPLEELTALFKWK